MRKNSILFICLILVFAFAAGTLQAERKVSPLSKEFVNYPANPDLVTPDGHPLGYRPDPADFSHLKGVVDPRVKDTYDASYDLRTLGKLTAVRDQANCGACWAFASFASLESWLMPGETNDFAEQDLNANHGFDYAECAGGNRTMSMAYLTRWSGPLNESDVPYDHPYLPEGDAFVPLKHVQGLNYLPARASSTDNDTIKYFVTTYGAVQVSYYHSNTFYNATYKSYYKDTAYTGTNHAVAIVGWDDNFPAANFNTAAPGNGAFIIRNSWGSSWGDGGYFYMSYYDTAVRNLASFNYAESASNYDFNYQYDHFGYIYGFGWGDGDPVHATAWGANIFTASEPLSIKSVGFFANDVNAGYEIYVYKGVTAGSPVSGTLAATKTGSNVYAGFYTVTLDTPVFVANGELFSVVVKFMNSTYTYPVPCDGIVSGFSSACTSNAGESFYSDDGAVWEDLYDYGAALNCNIKAYADSAPPSLTLTSPDGWEHWSLGATKPITWTSENYTGTVRLVLFKDGVRFGNIATGVDAAAGTYDWTVGSTFDNGMAAAGVNYRIYLRSTDNTVVDTGKLRFALINAAPQLELTSPNDGEGLVSGATADITWNANGYAGTVRLVLFNKGIKIGQIAANIPASQGTYSWTVGQHQGGMAPAGSYYSIRLLAGDGSQEDYSDSPFDIVAP